MNTGRRKSLRQGAVHLSYCYSHYAPLRRRPSFAVLASPMAALT